MRNIEFQEVGMQNYGPYIDPMIHTFQPDTLTLLKGPNGIGKTMSLDAIPFTLYGVTSKKAKGDDVVNNVVGRNCKTWVKFKIDSDQYIVTRYHKYTKVGNTVIINKNGVDTMKGHREVVPELERLICPQKAFMNTLMFGQKVKDFFTDLVDSDKKEIFRKILGLEQYVSYYKQADYKLKLAKTDQTVLTNDIKINQGILEDAQNQIRILKEAKKKFYETIEKEIKELRSSLDDNNRLLETWQSNLSELQSQESDVEETKKQISEIENTLKNSENKTTSMLENLEQQKLAKISELQSSASEAKMGVQKITAKDLEDMNQNKSDLVKKQNDAYKELKQRLHEIESEKNSHRFEIDSLTDLLHEMDLNVVDAENSICPTCEQEVTDDAKQKLIDKAKMYEEKIASLIQKDKECDAKLKQLGNDLKQETEKYDRMITAVDREIERCKKEESEEYKKINYRLSNATDKVGELVLVEKKKIEQSSADQTKELQDNLSQLQVLKSKQENILSEIQKVEETILRINQQIKSITDTIAFKESQVYDETQLNSYYKKEIDISAEIDDCKNKMVEVEEQIEMLSFWKTGFSPTGIPSMLIDESIPFMNRMVSHYLDMLTNGRYVVSFDTLDEIKSGEFRDKISVRVIDTHTQANSRVQLSGGQTRIIDIATILTLGDLQSTINDVTVNILLFDEIFDALDYDNVGYVSKVLNKIKLGKSIVVISHQHQDQLEPDELLSLS